MATMEHPVYSLSTKPDQRILSYWNGDCRIEIIPSSIGLPTVFDKDIIIYCISKLMQARNRGEEIKPTVRLTTHDMLVETNRQTNNLGYQRLLPALNRLRGVVINTTIATGKERTTRGFGLIDAFEYSRRGSMHADRLKFLEITLSDWIFRAIASAEVLPISRDYFRLRAPVDRRLYELARKHCGQQASWRIGTELLQKKVGSKEAPKHFHAHLRNIVRSNHLPDFAVVLEDGQAVFVRREEARRRDGATGRRRAVSTARRQTVGAAASHAGIAEVADQRRPIRITQAAFDQVADLAPGWDRYGLERLYLEWAATKDAARSEDARFLKWVTSYTKGRRP